MAQFTNYPQQGGNQASQGANAGGFKLNIPAQQQSQAQQACVATGGYQQVPVQPVYGQQPVQQMQSQPQQQQPIAEQVRFNYETGQMAETGTKYYDTQTGLTTDESSYFGTPKGAIDQNANYFAQNQSQQPVAMQQQAYQQQPVVYEQQNGYYQGDEYYQDYNHNVAMQNYQNAQRWEPNFFPEKLLPKKTDGGNQSKLKKGFEFILDGYNLSAYDKPKDSTGRVIEGQEGRRISFESKFHMNFWTYSGPQNTQQDFLQIYGDTSRLAGLMQTILNGQIFNLTQQAVQQQSYPVIWDNVGGTDKANRYKVNGMPLAVPYVATRLALRPGFAPGKWVFTATVSEGVKQANGAIFAKGGTKPLCKIEVSFNYFELCSLATYVLNSIQADMNAVFVERMLVKREHNENGGER